jgi:hypothetical protein
MFAIVAGWTSLSSRTIRRSVVLLAPRHPAGLDREAAIAILAELQRLQSWDRQVTELLDRVSAMIETVRNATK